MRTLTKRGCNLRSEPGLVPKSGSLLVAGEKRYTCANFKRTFRLDIPFFFLAALRLFKGDI